ncbi:hypothetical protein EC960427_3031B, partial [Escherichia coli 96.0427]
HNYITKILNISNVKSITFSYSKFSPPWIIIKYRNTFFKK